jgi:hypothetical protein
VYRIPPGGGDLELVVDRDEFDMPKCDERGRVRRRLRSAATLPS